MFIAAARAVASEVTEDDLRLGRIYPPLDRIRPVSARIAEAVAGLAFDRGLARHPRPANLLDSIRSMMFEPVYPDLRRA
jgi:malate dehydrogenase (oxaloacetate-decarboxylating)(NADP+)